MSQEPDIDQTVTVSRGDVTVEKSFEPDEFPVPAVMFRIDSSDSEPVELRLVDQIPAEFPMSAIGFHPDFESDSWIAYQDHRVVFERTLDSEEVIETVYGVRLDREEDAVAFLDKPTLEGIEESAESVDDILGEDRNQAVRDVLAGERDSLTDAGQDPTTAAADDNSDAVGIDLGTHDEGDADELGLDESEDQDEEDTDELDLDMPEDEEDADELDLDESQDKDEDEEDPGEIGLSEPTADQNQAEGSEQETPAPRSPEDGAASAVEERSSDATVAESPEITESESEAQDESTVQPDQEPDTGAEKSENPPAVVGAASSETAAGGVAETLAQEIRDGDIAEDDLAVLRDELDVGLPRSADVRIQRLQRTVADMNAYVDALEEFIDEEGTAKELIDSFRGDVEQLSETIAGLDNELAATTDDVETLQSDLSGTDRRLESIDEDVQGVAANVEDIESDLDTVDDEVMRVTGEMEHVTTEIAEVTDQVETLRTDLDEEVEAVETQFEERTDELEATVQDQLDDLRQEMDQTVEDSLAEAQANDEQLAALEAEFQEFREFRDRVEQAFGGMGGVDTGNDE